MIASDRSRQWYALHTRSRFENVVLNGLERKEIEAFLPKVAIQSRRLDRKKMIQVPLFPGYLFVKASLDPHEHLGIVKTIGVVTIVGNLQGPIAIPVESIESLKIMVLNSQEIVSGLKYKHGDRVRVVSGPFVGVWGEFVRYRGKGRVVVNIAALGQNAAVNVSEDDIEVIRDDLLITA
ncbi:MAG: UpxY family transcription antiterminator [Deltaproteobacteria bacterium]|nr:UpxY family transcription antiterminator [Deltaproteobacteria bacterium]